jgi:hypothetical protein
MATTPLEEAQVDRITDTLEGVVVIPMTIAEAPRSIDGLSRLGLYQLRVLMRLFGGRAERGPDELSGIYKMSLIASVAMLLRQHDAYSEMT